MATKLTRDEPVVFHFRVKTEKETEPKAGATVVFLPATKRFGIAMCCSRDRYNKKWGRKIATIRAREGDKGRIRTHRFLPSREYDGPLEMDAVRRAAFTIMLEAAEATGNPLCRLWSEIAGFTPLG